MQVHRNYYRSFEVQAINKASSFQQGIREALVKPIRTSIPIEILRKPERDEWEWESIGIRMAAQDW